VNLQQVDHFDVQQLEQQLEARIDGIG